MKKRLTNEEIEQWIFDNCYDEKANEINLRNLNFRRFNCNVDISFMEVNGELTQCYQKAKEINQKRCEAEIIYQGWQKANTIWQDGQEAEIIYQHDQCARKIIQDEIDDEEDDDE